MKRSLGLACFFLLGLQACVDPIDVSLPEDAVTPQLVVDGRITLGQGPYYLRLAETQGLEAREERPIRDAEVVLVDDQGNREAFEHQEDGNYMCLGERIVGQLGRTYQVEITRNGKVYRSTPDRMPPPIDVDRVYFEVNQVERINLNGNLVDDKMVELFLDTSLPDLENGPYLRWEIREAWKLTETSHPSPFVVKKVCYFQEIVSPQEVFLLDGSTLNAGLWQKQPIGSRLVDWTFTERHVFYVSQLSISEAAYRYWEEVDEVSNQVGSLFDRPPGAVIGNVRNVDNPQEIVLGYFEATARSEGRVVVFGSDVSPPRLIPFCFNTWEEYVYQRQIPVPQHCHNCTILEGASLERPENF